MNRRISKDLIDHILSKMNWATVSVRFLYSLLLYDNERIYIGYYN